MELVDETAMNEESSGAAVRVGSGRAAPDFESVFFEYYGQLVSILCRMVGDRARAEELVADTFLKLLEQRQPVERFDNIGGWLYRTATRLGIDSLRAALRRQRYEQLAAGESGSAESPLDDVLRAETCRNVRAALARLKPLQAQILLLRASGFSYRELAAALAVKTTSVGRLLGRAEAAFQKTYRRIAASPRR